MLIPNKLGMMTHEQVGYILALSDELGEWDKGIYFIRDVVEYGEAKKLINELEDRIYKERGE